METQKPVIIDKFTLRLVISQYNPEGKNLVFDDKGVVVINNAHSFHKGIPK